jgi:hypothetical protein
MKYEVHRCHTDHIRRKLKAQEASDDEIDLENMDIGDFKTVDSIGNVDDEDINEEGNLNFYLQSNQTFSSKEKFQDADNEEETVGIEMVSKIEAHFCSVCHEFVCRDGDDGEEELIADHCKSRRHIHRFNDYKREEERKEAKVASPEKSPIKQNGSDTKHEKNDTNEVDRDADVNLDENTYEGSENQEDN